jgi:hypothetical protein
MKNKFVFNFLFLVKREVRPEIKKNYDATVHNVFYDGAVLIF